MLCIRAYSFLSRMSLPEIRARCGELTAWQWIERDSDRLGEYISARAVPDPERGMVKIFIDCERFVVDLKLEAEPQKIDAVYDIVFTLLLPAIGATEIVESDPIE